VQKLLLAQLLAAALDLFAVVLFVNHTRRPDVHLVASRDRGNDSVQHPARRVDRDQAVARGARQFRAYALAIVLASVFALLRSSRSAAG